MAVTLETATRNAACDAIVDLIDGGAGAGIIEIYTTGEGTLLATLTFSDPAYGSAASGTASANSITDDTNVDASGTAAEFVIKDSNSTRILSGSVGATSSGEDIEFDDTSFVAGGTASISSLDVTVPSS